MDPERELPTGAGHLARHHAELWDAYTRLGRAAAAAGPLDATTRRLVKIALAVALRSEGAVHSHVRRALAEGIAPEAIRHVALLAIPTIGLPAAVAALTWMEDILSGTRQEMPDTKG